MQDDTVLVTGNFEDLPELLDFVVTERTKKRLPLNTKKTETMFIPKKNVTPKYDIKIERKC